MTKLSTTSTRRSGACTAFAPAPYSPVLENELTIGTDAIVQAVLDLRDE